MIINLSRNEKANIKILISEQLEREEKMGHHLTIDMLTDLMAKLEEESKTIPLYYHETSGGAKYLFDTFIEWEHEGKSGKEGAITDETKFVVRIDGDITKDAELTIKD